MNIMKTKSFLFVVLILSIVWSAPASAGQVDAASVSQTLISKMAVVSAALSSKAMIALGVFATLQMVITNFGLLKSGADIEAIFAKFIGSLAWIGFCVYVLQNGPAFISGVGNEFFAIPGLELPTVGTIMKNTAEVAAVIGALAWPVGVASNTLGSLLIYLLLIVLAVGCFFAFKIFMLQLELGLVVMLSPLSFAFLGLNPIKDQGIAPFKSLISLVYRIILIGVILSGFTVVDDAIKAAFSNLSVSDFVSGLGNIVSTICAALGAYLLLAYLVYKSDSIAASLAGGSTSMGTADVASAAAMGAAAGAAVASGGASAAAAATKPVQSMADFMKGLKGGGSVSNASATGSGGSTSALPLSPPPVASMGSGSSASGGPAAEAAAPAFETNKAGAPMNPDPNAQVAGPANTSGGGASGAPKTPTPTSGSGSTAGEGGTGSSADTSATSSPANPGVADTSSPSTSPASGSSANIGGTSSPMEQKKDALLAASSGGQKTATAWDHAKELNQHIAQEKAHTSVSINTHHSD